MKLNCVAKHGKRAREAHLGKPARQACVQHLLVDFGTSEHTELSTQGENLMRLFDRILQTWRARLARTWIPPGASVLDVGCHQGEFLRSLGRAIGPSVGLDPLAPEVDISPHHLLPLSFAEPLDLPDESFDSVVMLATLEHIRDKDPLARECARLLRPGGRVIITVPSPRVDGIVHFFCRLGLADGMSLDEHHGFDPRTTLALFTRHGLELEQHRRFQLGLNNLYVFRKPIVTDAPISAPHHAAGGLVHG
jgi:SAM-dependent methyltransferase